MQTRSKDLFELTEGSEKNNKERGSMDESEY